MLPLASCCKPARLHSLRISFFSSISYDPDMGSEAETIYDRVTALEEEVAVLRHEVNLLKQALRNTIARHEISMVKKGVDIKSIID